MNRILFPLLALGFALLAFSSFIAVSLIGLAGVLTFSLAKGISRITARISGQPTYNHQNNSGRPQDRASMESGTINRIWNDGRGKIIDM